MIALSDHLTRLLRQLVLALCAISILPSEQLLREFSLLHRSRGSMTRSHSKGPASWVMPASIAFAGLCIFGASLVIHEPLEKIATRESYTIVLEDKTVDSLKTSTLRGSPITRH